MSASSPARRARILDATLRLAARGGFEAVRMRAVAEEAEVALGTLYRYFPSKVHLLVSALEREFEYAERALRREQIPGAGPADRVLHVLLRASRGFRGDPQLTAALTRAFMSADGSVAAEIRSVSTLLTAMLTRAMRPADVDREPATADEELVAQVVGDVWIASLVGWVTGRVDAEATTHRLERAVRLLLPHGAPGLRAGADSP